MNQQKKHTKEIVFTIIFVSVLAIILIITFFFAYKSKDKETELPTEEIIEEKIKINPLDLLKIEAQSGIVKNLNTGEVYFSKNIQAQLPLASLTKLMTAVVVYENADINSNIQLGFEQLQTEGEYALYAGENFYIKDLVDLTLVSSANDGAAVLAFDVGQKINKTREIYNQAPQATFVNEMNIVAKRIGMESTVFTNETGLDSINFTAGSKGTLRDLSKLMEYIFKNYPNLLDATQNPKISTWSKEGLIHNFNNTNGLTKSLPNILGGKTGYTDIAGGNLAVVVDPGLNTPIMIAVLGSSKEGRFVDVKRLSDTLLEYFSSDE